jgi:hypothetical protein
MNLNSEEYSNTALQTGAASTILGPAGAETMLVNADPVSRKMVLIPIVAAIAPQCKRFLHKNSTNCSATASS